MSHKLFKRMFVSFEIMSLFYVATLIVLIILQICLVNVVGGNSDSNADRDSVEIKNFKRKIMVEPRTQHKLRLPKYIRKRIRNILRSGQVKTSSDLERVLSVTQNMAHGVSKMSNVMANTLKMKGGQLAGNEGNAATLSMSMSVAADPDVTNPCDQNGRANCSVIDHPEHSLGVCLVTKHCVPIKTNREHHEIHFPECVILDQCLGHCCGTNEGCTPRNTNPVYVKVRKYAFTGMRGNQPKFEFVNNFYAEMEEHLDCSCNHNN